MAKKREALYSTPSDISPFVYCHNIPLQAAKGHCQGKKQAGQVTDMVVVAGGGD